MIRLESRVDEFDEILIQRVVRLASHIAKHFVPSWMLHRLDLGQFAAVFPIANRRVIVRQLGNPAGRELVEAAVAYVTDDQAADLLATTKRPTEAQIRTAMNGHLCRCGTYPRILTAIQKAAAVMAKGGK